MRPTTVYVIMANDSPDAVYDSPTAAEAHVRAENRPNGTRDNPTPVLVRSYAFHLQATYTGDEKKQRVFDPPPIPESRR